MEIDKVHIRHCMLFQFNFGKTAAEVQRLICSAYGKNAMSSQNLEVVISISLINHVLEGPRSWNPKICKHCWIKMILNQVYNLWSSYKLIIQLFYEGYMQWEKFKRNENGFHISSVKAKCNAEKNNGTWVGSCNTSSVFTWYCSYWLPFVDIITTHPW